MYYARKNLTWALHFSYMLSLLDYIITMDLQEAGWCHGPD